HEPLTVASTSCAWVDLITAKKVSQIKTVALRPGYLLKKYHKIRWHREVKSQKKKKVSFVSRFSCSRENRYT
ncbi:MAG: hypothetical protein P8Z70_10670, partial [Desulfuromonadales bacterium]